MSVPTMLSSLAAPYSTCCRWGIERFVISSRNLPFVFFLCMLCAPCMGKGKVLPLESPDNASALKKGYGYLLVNLSVEGVAPSLEIAKLSQEQIQRIEQTRTGKKDKYLNTITIDLKNRSDGLHLAKMKAGVYQILQVSSPYFDLPYKLSTKGKRQWRFTIEPNTTSYIGLISIKGERSTTSVDIRLINRVASDYLSIHGELSNVLRKAPLRSGLVYRDDFLRHLNNEKY